MLARRYGLFEMPIPVIVELLVVRLNFLEESSIPPFFSVFVIKPDP